MKKLFPCGHRGRPKDPGKRTAILAAARALFFDNGFDAVTMDRIVNASGVSRATVYANFSDKAAIFEAVVAQESERIVSDEWVSEHSGDRLEATLTAYGEALLRFLWDPDMTQLERVVSSASRSFPKMAPQFFAAGPGRQQAILRGIIVEAQRRGEIPDCDADLAASDLVGLWQGHDRARQVFEQTPAPNAEQLADRVRHGVAQFLRLYSSTPCAGPA